MRASFQRWVLTALAILIAGALAAPILAEDDANKNTARKKKPAQSEALDATKPVPPKKTDTPESGDKSKTPKKKAAPGVTVLIEGWQPPRNAADYPPGVTALGPEPAGERPKVWVRVPLGPPPPKTAETEDEQAEQPGQDLTEDPATAVARRRTRAKKDGEERPRETVGPSLEEQQQVFGELPLPGGTPLSTLSGWQPTSAYPDRDPANPYPWQPVTWSTPTFDTHWQPTNAYDPGDLTKPYRWNRVTWPSFIIDPTWTPTDVWGRQLGFPEPLPPAGEAETQDTSTPPPGGSSDASEDTP